MGKELKVEEVARLVRFTGLGEAVCRAGVADARDGSAEAAVIVLSNRNELLPAQLTDEGAEAVNVWFKVMLRKMMSPETKVEVPAGSEELSKRDMQKMGQISNSTMTMRLMHGVAKAAIHERVKLDTLERDVKAARMGVFEHGSLPKLKLGDDAWTGTVTLPAWAKFSGEGEADIRLEAAQNEQGEWKMPSAGQVAALEHFLANIESVTEVFCEGARKLLLKQRDEYKWDNVPDAENADLCELLRPHTIHVVRVEKGGRAYVGIEAGCEWDDEHGFGVMLHGQRLVEYGQADAGFDSRAGLKDGGAEI